MIYQMIGEKFRCAATAILLSFAVFLGSVVATFATEDASRVQRFDVSDALDTLAEELARGLRNSQLAVEAIDEASKNRLDDLLTVQDYRHAGFSARTQITAMYNLAEAHSATEGDRFIAKLHKQVAASSLIVQNDLGLQSISRQFTAAELDAPIQYAALDTLSPAEVLKQLPANVDAAVKLLSDAIAPNDLGQVVTLMERHFRLDARGQSASSVIDKAVLSSTDPKTVFMQIINAHTPPPKMSASMGDFVLDVASRNATLSINPDLAKTLQGLADDALPEEVAKLTERADTLPSRIAQQSASSGGRTISNLISNAEMATQLGAIVAEGGVEALANNGGGSGGGGPSYQNNRRAHADYGRRTHSGPSAVSRSFSRAIRSSRAARGVAVGAEVNFPSQNPTVAYWIPSKKDASFGRAKLESGVSLI